MDSSSFISFLSASISSAKYESQQEQPYLYIGFGEDQMYMKVHFKWQTVIQMQIFMIISSILNKNR